MVANDGSRSVGSDDDIPVTSLTNGVMNGRSLPGVDLQCPHCNFRCTSLSTMTHHSWEQHPLLMRRKKHLISSSKPDSATSSSSDDTQGSSTSSPAKSPVPVQQTAQQMENCSLSGEVLQRESQQNMDQATMAYRNNALRSLSLLSTAAAIIEQQSQPTPQRHIAVVKPQPVEIQHPACHFPQFPEQPVYAPTYNAYIPSLNQYVTIPIHMAPAIPNPAVLNASIEHAMKAYLQTQLPPNTQFTQPLPQPISYIPPKDPTPQRHPPQTTQQLQRPLTDEIRTLLQTNVPIRKMAPPSKITNESPLTKIAQIQPPEPAQVSPPPTLQKDRVQALEKAILSMDCCDINDSSTTMPFKCADGVWRMVSFKCIKGLWVVQTPDSSTPTVYVPCDDEQMVKRTSTKPRRAVRSISEGSGSGHKRKLSDNIRYEAAIDAKRLCASAPIPDIKTENYPENVNSPLKRTLSNPFITKSLPAPSQQFTNNEGKRVNISMIKRNSTQTSSCNLIKSLLLRKPAPRMTSSVHDMTSSIVNSNMQCKTASGSHIAATLSQPTFRPKNSMVY